MLETLLLAYPDWLLQFALLVVRVALGACIVVHGLGKLGFLKSNPAGVKGFVGWLESMGMPYPRLNAWAATLTELSLATTPCSSRNIPPMAASPESTNRRQGFVGEALKLSQPEYVTGK